MPVPGQRPAAPPGSRRSPQHSRVHAAPQRSRSKQVSDFDAGDVVGVALTSAELNRPDSAIDWMAVAARSSIREIARTSPLRFSRLLRGPASLGGLFQAEDISVVPGPAMPGPGSAPYFNGGYNTRVHGSRDHGEVISGVQLEHHYRGLRDTGENRRAYAAKVARAIRAFMLEHYGFFEAAADSTHGYRGS